jgi:hypothetical protein
MRINLYLVVNALIIRTTFGGHNKMAKLYGIKNKKLMSGDSNNFSISKSVRIIVKYRAMK